MRGFHIGLQTPCSKPANNPVRREDGRIDRKNKKIYPAADNAFSYCDMDFSQRMDAIKKWNALLTPENIMGLIKYIEDKDEEIEQLQEKVYLLIEQIE
ncbi:hypothetical protein LU604_07005 [Erwinia tracheiphila]|uniref:hypothetical protein n=2 Tax=Erwinia tracheiphila TaxID=65700 RepID=UPI001F3D245D|nr:hypothetical protein [Erwinia tracheiphila]UIA84682.1 hypothetical protein LU604_07005 [Erwinia tracheiphila]